MQQVPVDTGQQQNSLPPKRRASSIPRPMPSLATNIDNHRANAQASPITSPQASTPDALNFYKTRRPTNPASTTLPNRPFDPAGIRSNSGQTLKSATSNPTVARPHRMEKTSFKDLVARFNDSAPTNSTQMPNTRPARRKPSPSPRDFTSSNSFRQDLSGSVGNLPSSNTRASQLKPRPQPVVNGLSRSFGYENPAAREGSSNIPRPSTADHSLERISQQKRRGPLFGEVFPGQSDVSNGGYGISPQKRRRGSEGSMRIQNAMFPSNNSFESGHSQSIDRDESPNHRRSQSAMVNGTPSRRELNPNQEMSQSSSRNRQRQTNSRTNPRSGSPQSRIPLPRSSSGYGSPNISPRPIGPTVRRSLTPPSFGQALSGAQSLHAIINAPIPQKSPPLRSSRPRQDVNSARSISPNTDRGMARTSDSGSPRRRNASLDVLSRQDSIRRALRANRAFNNSPDHTPQLGQNGIHKSPEVHQSSYFEQPSQEWSQAGAQEDPTHLRPTTYQRPGLKINVSNVSRHDEETPNTGTTQFEEDESPVLEVPGSFPDDEGQQEPVHPPESQRQPEDGHLPDISAPGWQSRSRTVLSQILEIRGARDTIHSLPTDSPSLEKEDAGTIQIMLGETPAQESAGSDWYRRELHTGKYYADSNRSASGGLPPTINGNSNLSPSPCTTSRSDGDAASQLTHESDSYSAINRILDQYHQSGIISPEMVHDFQQYIVDTDPELNFRDEQESMIVARAALEDIIKDRTRAAILAEEAGAIINSDDGEYSPYTPSDPTGLGWNQRDGQPSINESATSTIHEPTTTITARLEANGDTPGPTPPPKDAIYPSPATQTGTSTLSAANFTTEAHLLPETPRTGGSLGLKLTPSMTSLSSGGTITQSAGFIAANISPIRSAKSMDFSTPGSQRTDQSLAASTPPTEASRKTPLVTPVRNLQAATAVDGSSEARDSAIGSRSTSIEEKISTSSPPESVDENTRRLMKRRNVIKELIDTEASYNQDMKVIEDIYKGTANACDAVTADDCRVLFGNSTQIVLFSESFLAALKKAGSSVYVMPPSNKWRQNRGSFSTSNSARDAADETPVAESTSDDDKDRMTFVGEAFNQNMTQMEELYTNYLRNHDYANQRLKKLQEVSKVKLWLNECHTYAADITSAWDLDSLLVKPVQRVLKYPLLLKGLLECTPEDHPDFSHLKKAVKEMMDTSYRINESKKRAEVLEQVMKNTKRKDFDISKLVGRRTDKLRQQVGLSEAAEDAEYKKLAQRFETRYVHLQIVMRDFEVYKKSTDDFMNQFTAYMRAVEDMVIFRQTNSPELESKWRKLVLTIREMQSIAHADHEAAVSRHCIEPILTLIKLHEAPQKLMMKRKKRIVEYAKYFTQKNRGEKVDKKTQEQGEQFIALNETLKDELPKLFHLSSKLIEACLKNFVDIQVHWHSIWQRKVKTILEEQDIPMDIAKIVDSFNADFSYVEAHVLSLGICNGSLLADVSNFLSSSTASFATDETLVSAKRPSLHKSTTGGDQSPSLRESDRLSGSSFPHINTSRSSSDSQRKNFTSQQQPYSYHQERFRASSNVSNQSTRNPSRSITTGGTPYVPHQESRQNRADSSHSQALAQAQAQTQHPPNPRMSTSSQISQVANPARPLSSSTFYSAANNISPNIGNSSQQTTHRRTPSGGPFSSAMPMSDSRPPSGHYSSQDQTSAAGQRDYQVLFLAASLYDFNIKQERSEAGYPYLFYTPGEVFDVIGQKGELWLAKNQDDPNERVGWIWEKHFARLLHEE